jgi:nucleotide sugar dehydrogenase
VNFKFMRMNPAFAPDKYRLRRCRNLGHVREASPLKVLSLSNEEVEGLLVEGKLTIGIVGLGRIGLPSATAFAQSGLQVLAADIDPHVVELVNSGKSRFVDEPGLNEALAEVVAKGKLVATTSTAAVANQADLIIICVPTPIDDAKSPDYSYIVSAAKEVGGSLRPGSIVVVESTVGPGTVEGLVKDVLEAASGMTAEVDFGLAACPERSDPGSIMKNLRTVPRLMGAETERTGAIVAAVYESAFGVRVVRLSNPKTANAVKLTENLFRDVNIALANEFALLFERLGIDSLETINACASKYNFVPHYPGGGVGGPCLPSNSYYLITEGLKAGNIPYIVRLAREINDRMPEHVVELVGEAMNEVGKTIRGSKVAVLGVAYKPNIKDTQLTPVARVCERLVKMGALVEVFDPMFAGEKALGFDVRRSVAEAVEDADCIVIGTAHKEFKEIDLKELAKLVSGPAALVDSRNVVEPVAAAEAGFSYRGVGRPSWPRKSESPVRKERVATSLPSLE